MRTPIPFRGEGKRLLPLAPSFLALALAIALFLPIQQGACAEALPASYDYYFGNLHSHTSYSDGVLTPSDAFKHARDAARMDFHAVTDHGYYMQEATNLHHWFMALEEADRFYAPGRFVTLIGYEWTFTDGHINGFDTSRAASRDTQRSVPEFFEFLAEHNGIGMFNHPNYGIQPNWNDFEYSGLGDAHISLLEVGSGPYRHNIRNERAYRRALDRGWHIGATSDQDNHRADWGTAAPTRTCIIATELTREAVLSAMRGMHTYATEDSNVRVFFSSGESVMGDEIVIDPKALMAGEPLEFRVHVSDPDAADHLELVQIVASGGEVVWESELGQAPPHATGAIGGAYETVVTLAPRSSYNWYYLRAVQGDDDVIVTSPIWVTTGSGIAVCDFAPADAVVREGLSTRVKAEIVNRNKGAIDRVKAVLYETGESGRRAVSSQCVDLTGWAGTDIWFDWTPTAPGEARLQLELVLPGREVPELFQAAPILARGAGITRVLIDEGHNNRYSGYMDGLVALLAASDYSPEIGEDAIAPEVLAGTDILVVNLPEIGFALTPTSFEQIELEAIAGFVEQGGSLLLAGWSHSADGSRTSEQFNALLQLMQASVRFADDELQMDGSSSIHVHWGPGQGSGRPIFGSEACSLMAAGQAQAQAPGTTVFARSAAGVVFAAGELIGSGRVACLGAPVYSLFDLKRELFANSDFTLAVMAWLAGEEWTAH
jgi:hypothetical protein